MLVIQAIEIGGSYLETLPRSLNEIYRTLARSHGLLRPETENSPANMLRASSPFAT